MKKKNINRIENILVPVDFTRSSTDTINVAVEIAKRHQATITMVHVVENSFQLLRTQDGSPSVVMLPDLVTIATEHLKRLSTQFPGVTINTIVQPGNVADEICHVVLVNKINLIVMGKNTPGIKSYLGHTLARVIRHATCPVLAVPGGRITAFQNVLLPNEFPGINTMLMSLLDIKGTNVLVMAVLENHEPTTLARINHQFQTSVDVLEENDWPVEKILLNQQKLIPATLETIRKNNIDLIVVTPALDPEMRKIFPAANAQNIINLSPCAVLSLRQDRDPEIQDHSDTVALLRTKIKLFRG
jgi:nucleotide-binding universal stress UspA family protein